MQAKTFTYTEKNVFEYMEVSNTSKKVKQKHPFLNIRIKLLNKNSDVLNSLKHTVIDSLYECINYLNATIVMC